MSVRFPTLRRPRQGLRYRRPLLVCRPSPPRGGRKLVANPPKSNFDDATGLSPPPCLPLVGRGLRRSPPIERLQLVDQPFDHRQPLRPDGRVGGVEARSEGHTSELQSLMRTAYAVFCLKK